MQLSELLPCPARLPAQATVDRGGLPGWQAWRRACARSAAARTRQAGRSGSSGAFLRQVDPLWWQRPSADAGATTEPGLQTGFSRNRCARVGPIPTARPSAASTRSRPGPVPMPVQPPSCQPWQFPASCFAAPTARPVPQGAAAIHPRRPGPPAQPCRLVPRRPGLQPAGCLRLSTAAGPQAGRSASAARWLPAGGSGSSPPVGHGVPDRAPPPRPSTTPCGATGSRADLLRLSAALVSGGVGPGKGNPVEHLSVEFTHCHATGEPPALGHPHHFGPRHAPLHQKKDLAKQGVPAQFFAVSSSLFDAAPSWSSSG